MVCPTPCGRLATAATFIAIAVVQVLAGMVFIQSQFVYLLSAPNFWTAASNLSVGCLMGISANVWKDISKSSSKHTIRRNALYSLAGSAMVLNAVTAAILILGEGNTLLSIQLESKNRTSSTILASEILAYAYASSVCSPVIAVVVSLVYLSDMVFHKNDKDAATPLLKSILKIENSYPYDWVYERKLLKPDKRTLNYALSNKYLQTLESLEDLKSTSALSLDDWRASFSGRKLESSKEQTLRQYLAANKTLEDLSPFYISLNDRSIGNENWMPNSSNRRLHGAEIEHRSLSWTESKKTPLSQNPVQLQKKRTALKDTSGVQEIISENLNISCDSNDSGGSRSFPQRNESDELEVLEQADFSDKDSKIAFKDTANGAANSRVLGQPRVISRTYSEIPSNKTRLQDNSITEDRDSSSNQTIASPKSCDTDSLAHGAGKRSKAVRHKSLFWRVGEPPQPNLAGQVVAVQIARPASCKRESPKLIPVAIPEVSQKLSALRGFRQSMRVDPGEVDRVVSFSSFCPEGSQDACCHDSSVAPRPSASSCFASPQTSGYGSTLDDSLVCAMEAENEGQPAASSGKSKSLHKPSDSCGVKHRDSLKQDVIDEFNSALQTLKEKLDSPLISELLKDVSLNEVLKEALQNEHI